MFRIFILMALVLINKDFAKRSYIGLKLRFISFCNNLIRQISFLGAINSNVGTDNGRWREHGRMRKKFELMQFSNAFDQFIRVPYHWHENVKFFRQTR